MSDITWIRLRVDMFDDEKIKIIQSMPDGDCLLVVWIRLIALAGKCNANGYVCVEDEFPYSDEMLSTIFNKPLLSIRLALETFEKLKMISRTSKGVYITNFEKHQNIDGMERIREQNKIRKQRQRERQRRIAAEEQALLEDNTSRDINVTVTGEVTQCHATEKEKEEEKEKDNIYNTSYLSECMNPPEEPSEQPKEERILFDRIQEDYISICKDFPGIRGITETRKKKIRSLLKELKNLKIFEDKSPYEKLNVIFTMAQESDFLSGRSGKWDGCSFDWMINKTNALKILEGTYKNKGGSCNGPDKPAVPGVDRGTDSANTENEALERFRNRSRGL